MLFRYFIKDLYQRYDQLLLFTSLHFLISICRPTLYSITFEMSVAITHYISHGPSISAAVYFCYKGCDIIANYRALKVLSCAVCLYSPKMVNKATLRECELLSK